MSCYNSLLSLIGISNGTSLPSGGGQDNTSPTVSNATLTPTANGNDAVISYQKATDDTDAQTTLLYELYTSNTNNLGTVQDIEANADGSPLGNKFFRLSIDSAQVSEDLNNYVVYFNLNDIGSSHEFWNFVKSDGGDIRITTPNASSQLPFEVVNIDVTNNSGEIHFKTNTISSTTDNEFWVFYDSNNSFLADTDTYGANNVWNTEYNGVYHLHQSDTDVNWKDSSAVNGDGRTRENAVERNIEAADVIDGKLEKGFYAYEPGFETYSDIGIPQNITSLTEGTISGWAKVLSGGDDGVVIFGYRDGGSGYFELTDTGELLWTVKPTSSNTDRMDAVASTGAVPEQWYYMTLVVDSTGHKLYLDASEQSPTYSNGDATDSRFISDIGTQGSMAIGSNYHDTGSFTHESNGYVDEVRFSSEPRSQGWIQTEFNNQNNSSSFYTIGAQESSVVEAEDSGTDVNQLTITNLGDDELVWFNVTVADTSGNKTAYNQNSYQNADINEPTVSNKALTFQNTTDSSTTVVFNKATDNRTDSTQLTYKLYRASQGTDISTESAINSNGSLISTETDVDRLFDFTLTFETTYEFNVTVEDEADNITVYTQNSVTTPQESQADTQLPDTSGLAFDFDALQQSNVTVDSSAGLNTVSSLEDVSGNSIILTQSTKANQPVYDGVASEIIADGADDYLEVTNIAPINMDSASFFAVVSNPKTTNLDIIASLYTDGNASTAYEDGFVLGFSSGKLTAWYGNGLGSYETLQEGSPSNFSGLTVIGFTIDQNTRSLWVGNTKVATSTSDLSVDVNNLQLFTRGFDVWSSAALKTLVGYNGYKTDSQATTIINHLQTRYI